jgi:putative acetyltransferase
VAEVSIRPERPGDENAIRALVDAAFAPSTEEGRIVDDLRHHESWIPALALVVVDGDGAIVGQSLTTAGHLDGDDGTIRRILTLGPISVAPDRQRRGIGGTLMRATIAEATNLAWPVIVLVGHSTYYPRFGFDSARSIGLIPPTDWSDEHWMALRLPGWEPDLTGEVRYPPAFAID